MNLRNRRPIPFAPTSRRGSLATLLLALVLCGPSAASAAEVDWGSIEGKVIKVLYPGVTSQEFLKSADHGTGAVPMKAMKKACADCHISKDGQYDVNADKIVTGELKMVDSGKPLEPEAPAGMQGFKDVEVKAAFDAENIYLRFQWQGSGASVTDASLAGDDRADRLSVQINTAVGSFAKYGCWISCHNDQTGMPENKGGEVKLYNYYTRSEGAAVPQDKLDGFLSKGQFSDLWIASFEGSEVKASDQHVLQDRVKDQEDVSAKGGFDAGTFQGGGRPDGTYTVVMTRKLSTGDPGDIELKDGGVFNIAVAVHDNKNKGRHHYVSFPVSIGLSTAAAITAQRL